tara:strand:+ start:162 stop:518 length:357 start_codon:yes stop_codon:yes gene_type:complete
MSNIQVDYKALHKNATDTEREAYEKTKKSKLRRDILHYVYHARNTPSIGYTGSELCTLLRQILNSVRARLTDLEKCGYLMKTDLRRKNANDNNEIVYQITPVGLVTVEAFLKDRLYDQ